MVRFYEDPTTVAKILSFLRNNKPGFHVRAVKTAMQTGWLTDGVMLCRLNEKEQNEIRKKYSGAEDVQTAKLFPLEAVLKMEVKTMLDVIDSVKAKDGKPSLVILGTGKRQIRVRSDHYQFLVKRHPKAYFHMTEVDTEAHTKLAFSERTIIGCIMEYREEHT